MQKRIRNLNKGIALWLAVAITLFGFTAPSVEAAGYAYNDGTYTGTGTGRGGALSAEVTVENGRITEIEVGSNNETPSYLETAKGVINRIIAKQGTAVDTVSGATLSSRAIIEATEAALAQANAGVFDSGAGTEEAPFVIASPAQLQAFRNSVNQGETYTGQFVVLNSNIDISGNEWEPINNFAGTFDGAGHRISGLTIGLPEAAADCQNAGLFASLGATAVVKNLGVTGVRIYITNGAASTYAGGLAAKTNNGTAAGGTVIDNCYVTGTTVSSETTSGRISYAGGLVASMGQYGSVTNCWTDIAVKTKAGGTMSAYAGGLTALTGNNVNVVNCYTLGEVNATSTNLANGSVAGGLFGMQSGKSYNCYSRGGVAAKNIKADQSYQTTTYTLVGALAGQVPGNGAMDRMFYNRNAVLSVNEAVYDPVPPVGRGASNAEPTHVSGVYASDMASVTFVTALNSGLESLDEANIAIPGGVSLYKWKLSGNTATLSDHVYGGDEVDGDIFAGGEGTAEDPYILQTEAQLRAFAASLNEDLDYSGLYIRMGNNIDVSSEDWNPVGQGEYAFRGTFDGAGYKIMGLKYGSTETAKDATDAVYVALFGVVGQKGLIKNLGLTDVGIYTSGRHSVNSAAIAGYLEGGGIDNCFATGIINGKTTVQGNNFVGGLVANQYRGYIINSWSDVDVRSETVGKHVSEAGGLVSLNNRGLIANCYTVGNASGDAVRAAEGMAYVSNLVACQAGTIVNCYVLGNTVSDSYSFYVGAISGMTTGIGKGYLSYYNKDAIQMIDGQVPDPFVAVGTTISTKEDGVVSSGFNYRLQGYGPAEMKSDNFASVLNGNFKAFPVQLSEWLPAGTALKTWSYDAAEDIVVLTGSNAAVTYVPVVVNEENEAAYRAGTYYGRDGSAGGNEIIVKVTVTNDRITAIEVTSHKEGNGFDPEAVIAAVLLAQNTRIDYDTSNPSLAALLKAIDTALKKAGAGDTTGYGKAYSGIFAGGTGQKADPYQIATARQLAAFAASINADESYADKYVVLTRDISLKDTDWIPSGSGNAAHAFRGTFDGRGHSISDMTIGSETGPAAYQYAGIFGYANHAVIKNVRLTDAYINNHYSGDGRSYVGVLAGAVENATSIDNCSAKGTLTSRAKNQCYTGGLVSFTSGIDGAEGYVTNCGTDVDITGISDTSWVYLGGISGLNNRTYIVNCYSLGDGTANSTINVNKASTGGIAGFQAGYVRNCYTLGSMKTVLSSTDVGGYAGRHTGIATTYCAYYNTDAMHYSGNTHLVPIPGVGVYVPSSETGLVAAEKVEGEGEAYMKSDAFASLLNQNLTDENVSGVLPHDIALVPWEYNEDLGLTVLKQTPPTYTVTFNENGGNTEANPAIKTVEAGGKVDILPAAPMRTGYTFNGWNTQAGGGGTEFTAFTAVNADITVYAQWRVISGNGGDPSGSNGSPSGPTQTNTVTTTAPAGNAQPVVRSTTTAVATSNADGKATAAVTSAQIAEAVNKAAAAAGQQGSGTMAEVEIKVTAPENAKAVAVSLPKAAMDTVTGHKTDALMVSTPVASIRFDGDSLNTIANEASGDVDISTSRVDTATLSEEAKQKVGDRPVFNFSVTSGDKTISQFNGKVTVSVPYTPGAGEDPNAVIMYYINAGGQPELVSSGAYNPATGRVTFKTDHFSHYAVGYNKVGFRDVAGDAWYCKAVTFAAARGITTGAGDGNFNPEAQLTRGQFLVMVMRAYAISPEDGLRDNFADAGNTFYTGYLASAKRLGISRGTGNNRFEPDREITRQETATLLYNTLKILGELPAATGTTPPAAFSDSNQVAPWAKEAMDLFVMAGIVSGSNGRLAPGDNTNRAQMAQMLYNLLAE